MNTVLNRLTHSPLLPSYITEPILAGNPPPLADIVDALLIHAVDCLATLTNDPSTTLNEIRTVRASVAAAFLAAMALASSHSDSDLGATIL
jgi:hypothetical protein